MMAAQKTALSLQQPMRHPSLSPTEHNAVAGSYMNLLTYNTLFKSDMEMNLRSRSGRRL